MHGERQSGSNHFKPSLIEWMSAFHRPEAAPGRPPAASMAHKGWQMRGHHLRSLCHQANGLHSPQRAPAKGSQKVCLGTQSWAVQQLDQHAPGVCWQRPAENCHLQTGTQVLGGGAAQALHTFFMQRCAHCM